MAKFFDRLTQSCQSGRNAGVIAGMAIATAAAPAAIAGQPGWAHQATGFQSNGAVTVKSLAGGSYNSTQNPTGALAKASQSVVTQPPTVIIQATGSAYSETVPLMGATNLPPSCPAGYTQVFARSGPGCPGLTAGQNAFNVSGSRWSLVGWKNSAGSFSVGWLMDSAPSYVNGIDGNSYPLQGPSQMCTGTPAPSWGASLCIK